MQICDSWLREWFDHGLDPAGLADRLTMLGIEVESVTPVGAPVDGLVVGRVLEVRRHAGADRLSLCRVDVGRGEPLGIVCGASNVRAGGLYPTALEGACLPGGMVIKATRIRGEPSAGMLCSARELGLGDEPEGLLELDDAAVPGADASALLGLGDTVLDLNITPNRADCFSIAGVAVEVAAPGTAAVPARVVAPVPAAAKDSFAVTVADAADCPRFASRVVRGLRRDARSPLWLRERLRRCGVRPISPLVDVTNYVMLELGQPMHAYDLSKLRDQIVVRRGRPGESLTLLDGRQLQLTNNMLVIGDGSGPIGLAGIMGGEGTAVDATTTDIFLESAFFAPAALAGRARSLGLHTDASLRFERGVDPTGQVRALERATALLLEIAGGRPGPVADHVEPASLPARPPVALRRARLQRVLGAPVSDGDVVRILGRLGMTVAPRDGGWVVTPPPARFDVEREEDLIEEVARVHGYDRVPAIAGTGPLHLAAAAESVSPLGSVAATLVARGYHEAITYTFIEAGLGRAFGADDWPQLTLSNPISADMAVMRSSLWPGLVRAAQANLNRQQHRIRLFEIGSRFTGGAEGAHQEETCVAGIAVGRRLPEQWGVPPSAADVFDVKSDVEALLRLTLRAPPLTFEPASHPALHPGRSARIVDGERTVGWLGEIHPALARELDLPPAMLFEFEARVFLEASPPAYVPASRYPAVRRDLAAVVSRDVSSAALLATVRAAAPAALREAFVFDIYTGPQIGATEKSVAIGLILQDTSRTLTDEDADGILQTVRAALGREFQARIRE